MEKEIKTSRRRIYDVTNVLAGVGLVERSGKSMVRWIGGPSQDLSSNDSKLSEKEIELNLLTKKVDNELSDLTNSELFKSCAWIEPNIANHLEPNESISLYALTGPEKMSIQWKDDQHDPGSQIVFCKVDPSEGDIKLTPIRR